MLFNHAPIRYPVDNNYKGQPMRNTVTILLVSTLALSACQSRYNPVNWFGNGEEVIENPEGANPLIPEKSAFTRPEDIYPGVPVAKITELKIERIADGALIRAKGVADRQGVYALKLSPMNNGIPVNGVLTYELLGVHPKYPLGVGSEQSRQVIVAHSLTDQQLAGVRTIKVVAHQNTMQARR